MLAGVPGCHEKTGTDNKREQQREPDAGSCLASADLGLRPCDSGDRRHRTGIVGRGY